MTEALANLAACILFSMLGAYFLQAHWDFEFWPATAGCLYVLIFAKLLRS